MKKRDLKQLANLRNIPTTGIESSNELLNALHKDVYDQKIKKVILDIHQLQNKRLLRDIRACKINKYKRNILSEIRNYPYKKQQQQIRKSFRERRLNRLAKREDISQKDLNEIIR